ncbi:MAG: hypothetical protein KF856_13745 [Cyclobacteriaceae bacterium]|nr:hypothetical protein [Cyclobacteriaceae bacterium]
MKVSSGLKRFIFQVAMICVGVIGYNILAMQSKSYQPGDLGMGVATTSHIEYWHDRQINEIEGGCLDILPVIYSAKQENKKLVLLIGNSQLHAINYYNHDDHLTIYYLNKLASNAPKPTQFIQLSSPNINYQEVLLYYLTLRSKNALPQGLVIGCPYRTFHLFSLRKDFLKQLENLSLDSISLSKEVMDYFKTMQSTIKTVSKSAATDNSLQVKTENWITTFMEESWQAYRYRENLRAIMKVFPGIAYRFIFKTNVYYAGTEAIESLNMNFLNQLIELCIQDHVELFIYQPPQPKINVFPYDKTDYTNRFKHIEAQSHRSNLIHFRALENIVPNEFWGNDNAGRLDIFHFKDEGHRILADSLYKYVKEESDAF